MTSGFGYADSQLDDTILNLTEFYTVTLDLDVTVLARTVRIILTPPTCRNASPLLTLCRMIPGTFAGCGTAFHNPGDTGVQVACQNNDVSHFYFYPCVDRSEPRLCS